MQETCNPERAIDELRRCKQVLLAKLEQIKEDLDSLERSIQVLRGIEPGVHTEDVVAHSEGQAIDMVYAGLPPQKAIRLFFQGCPGRPFKPSELAKKLRSLGYQPTTSNPNVFVTQVRTACIRLKDKGFLRQTDVSGKVAFQHGASVSNSGERSGQ
jgi:hypothetical protein